MQWTLYAVGAFGYSLLFTALLLMHLYRYDPGDPNPYGWPVLASSALVGVAALLGRVFNPVASIVVGYLSDRTRSRWGRRRPFMAMALLPMLAGFVLVFTPPLPYASVWNAVYLAIALTIFLLSYSTYMAPYLALQAEIAHTTEQRIHLSTLVAFTNLLGFGVASVVAPWLVQQLGFLKMALVISMIGFMSLVTPLAIKEDFELPTPQRVPFWNSLQTIGQNAIFRPFITSQLFMWMTVSIIFLCTNYLVVALLRQDIGYGSIVNGAIIVGILAGFAPVNRLVKQRGKKAILRASLIWLGCNLLLLGSCSLWMRDTLWLYLVFIMLCGMSVSGLLLLPNAILADIVDEDMRKTGVQRGAIYYGMQAMIMTVSSGLASLLTGFILILGKTPVQPLGVQLVYVMAGCFAFGAAWFLAFYPLEK